jgi:hypothetical protein
MNPKKWLIGSIVGAIIVFAWQSASWMFLGIHNDGMKYTPAQNQIMDVLNSSITEEGLYQLPSAPTQKEQEEMKQTLEGKPWASIIYHKSFDSSMPMRIIRAFLIDLFLVVTLIYLLTRGQATPIARRIFAGSFAFGLAFFLSGEYTGRIWFDLPWHMIKGNLIDNLVSWSLCGIWLAWFLNKDRAVMA